MTEKWDLQRKLEEEINTLKNEKFDELINPCSVFMTFETEEGVNRAREYNDTVDGNDQYNDLKLWLGKHELDIQEASEPSDIIWENRHFTPKQRKCKEIQVCLILTLMLLASFIVIYIA